jgi:hypothetical protein
MAVGLVSIAPVYLNGLLALFCIFLLPGTILVRAFDIPNFPLRMLVSFLSSLIANHFLVVLIAALHLKPLATYRVVFFFLIALWAYLSIMDILQRRAPLGLHYGRAVAQTSDLLCLVASSALLWFAYRDAWASWPNIFAAGDVAVSWNRWAEIWAAGQFPTAAFGYPQFVPTIWAVTYIFTGSVEQYFAFYTYVILIFVPIVLVSMYLGRVRLSLGLIPVLAFAWLVSQIKEPWLRSTLLEGFPDWVAAVAGLCGVVLFATSRPFPSFDREKITTALASLCLMLIAAAIKPLYGLLAVAILIRLCVDTARGPNPSDRKKFLIAAAAIFAGFAISYLVYFLHLSASSMPNYPVTSLAERFLRAANQLGGNLGLPFRIVAGLGVVLAFFLPRIRWLAFPLLLGFLLWANTASYDLRNVLGFLAISAAIPLLALERTVAISAAIPSWALVRVANEARWKIPDGAVIVTVATIAIGATFSFARNDADLRRRFDNDQLRAGAGIELNQPLEQLLSRDCSVLSGAGYVFTLSAFSKYLPQLQFYHASLPLPSETTDAFNEQRGCTGIVYPPDHSSESVLNYVKAKAEERHYVKLGEGNGWELLASPP